VGGDRPGTRASCWRHIRTRIGYLLKDRIVSTDEFVDALRRVADGGTALDPEVVRQLLATPAVDAGIAGLSVRERDNLARLAEGRSNLTIAQELHLAPRSVEKHMTSSFTKLALPQAPSDHRRVLAVLRYLSATHRTLRDLQLLQPPGWPTTHPRASTMAVCGCRGEHGNRTPSPAPTPAKMISSVTDLLGDTAMTDSTSGSNRRRWLRKAIPIGMAVLLTVDVTAAPAPAATAPATPTGPPRACRRPPDTTGRAPSDCT
jgi:DNA-binding CsgD family transcriptional regulator